MPAQIISPSAPSFASSPRLSHVDTGTGVYQHLTQEDGYWNPSHVHHPNRFMDIANNVVPPPSMQPSSQHAYPDRPVHLRNGQFMVPSSTMPMMHHHAGYHPSLSALTSSQFVRAQAITTLPAPRAHKVWILDCKACGTFLTNRGMKAVLLLRPNVPLYSTDAPPINCSAYSSPPSPSASSSRPVLASPPPAPTFAVSDAIPVRLFTLPPPPTSRTCECLTQTLHCHTCGGSVGYTIVAPCARCTAPTATHRGSATNGHRFVFYASDILAQERRYVPGERGVVPFHPQWQSPVPVYPAPFTATNGMSVAAHPTLPVAHAALRSSEASSPVSGPNQQPAGSNHGDLDPSRLADASAHPAPTPPSISASASAPAAPVPNPHTARAREPDRLRSGDVVYWHNLARNGEIPAVSDDPRARACPERTRSRSGSGLGSREIRDQPGAGANGNGNGNGKGGDASCAPDTGASQSSRRREIFAGR